MRKPILIIMMVVGSLILSTQGVEAAILSKQVDRTYTLKTDSVHVKEQATLQITDSRYLIQSGTEETFVIFNPAIDDNLAQEKIDKTLPTIRVKDGNGNKLKFSAKQEGQNINIKIKRTKGLLYGSKEVFIVEYDSFALSTQTGAVYDLYIPSFAKDFPFEDETTKRTINTRVIIPQAYGEINLAIPDKKAVISGKNWRFDFTQKELTGRISWIQVGTTQYYEFHLKQPYSASSTIPLLTNTYSVLLPRDVQAGPLSQKVSFTSITPEPQQVTTDSNGNLLAEFAFPANKSGSIEISGFITLNRDRSFKLDVASNLNDISEDLLPEYTQAGKFWEVSSPEISTKALELKGEETDIYSLITTTYEYIVDQIDYSEVKRFGINTRQGALKTLQGGAAVCMEYSDLFIALMRAQGVPARAAFGYGFDARSTNGEETAHQWAEVYHPKLDTWILVDTTWGESGSAVIGGDLNHFYKYVASVDPQTPSPVEASFFGQLDSIPNEEFTIEAKATTPQEEGTTTQEVLLQKYPPQENLAKTIEKIGGEASRFVNSINQLIATFLMDQLGLEPNLSQQIGNIAVIIPVLILLTWSLLMITRKLRSTTSNQPSSQLK